jgi:hypothetical protein
VDEHISVHLSEMSVSLGSLGRQEHPGVVTNPGHPTRAHEQKKIEMYIQTVAAAGRNTNLWGYLILFFIMAYVGNLYED